VVRAVTRGRGCDAHVGVGGERRSAVVGAVALVRGLRDDKVGRGRKAELGSEVSAGFSFAGTIAGDSPVAGGIVGVVGVVGGSIGSVVGRERFRTGWMRDSGHLIKEKGKGERNKEEASVSK
jgi:hypothetical protein